MSALFSFLLPYAFLAEIQSMIETTRLGEKICTSILLNGEGRKQIVKPDYTERN